MPVLADNQLASGDDALHGPGFGIYVHWPFCKAKCPYCDFNSHVRHARVDQPRFALALVRELERFAERLPGRNVDSIFFGGGTPSLMEPETVAAVIGAVRDHWPLADDAEVSLEANPTSVEAGRFAAYAAAGVNRVSLGVQSLRDDALTALGRQHTASEALDAFDIARQHFARVSFDLIYARPQQRLADWRAELSEALNIAVDHMSLYQLTIEQGTAFFELHQRGRLRIPGDELGAQFYELTQDLCSNAGLDSYEVSNHARPGSECRHNLVYWRGGEWAGIGPGAHGRIGDGFKSPRVGTTTERHPESWLERVERDGHGFVAEDRLTRAEAADEVLLMGLRLAEGVDLERYERLGGHINANALTELIAEGLAAKDSKRRRIRLTGKGRLVANAAIAALAG